VPFQGLTKEDKQRIIDARISSSNEIFSSCLSQANALIRNEFKSNGGSTVWHDADKNRAVDVAKLIFSRVVSYNDVKEIAQEVHFPQIEDIKVTRKEGDGKDMALGDNIGSF
jgi:hypothetical protein